MHFTNLSAWIIALLPTLEIDLHSVADQVLLLGPWFPHHSWHGTVTRGETPVRIDTEAKFMRLRDVLVYSLQPIDLMQ